MLSGGVWVLGEIFKNDWSSEKQALPRETGVNSVPWGEGEKEEKGSFEEIVRHQTAAHRHPSTTSSRSIRKNKRSMWL